MKSIEGERIAIMQCGRPKRRQIDREEVLKIIGGNEGERTR